MDRKTQNEVKVLMAADRADYVVESGLHATAHRLVRASFLNELTHPRRAFHVRITSEGRSRLAVLCGNNF